MSVVLVAVRDQIAHVTLNRPEARNAVSPELAVRLARAWETLRDTDDARAILLSGAGDKAFCAGADLARLIPLTTGAREPQDEWDEALRKDSGIVNRALLRSFDPGKPIVCCANGHAIAGGLELLLATDIRVAAEGARFGLQEAKWGLLPAAGGTVRLPRQVPYAIAMDMLLTGSLIPAERALAVGLVNQVVAPAAVRDAALERARALADCGPVAVREIRRSVKGGLDLPEREALALESKHAAVVFATRDAVEGPRAFQEKRTPKFEGR